MELFHSRLLSFSAPFLWSAVEPFEVGVLLYDDAEQGRAAFNGLMKTGVV